MIVDVKILIQDFLILRFSKSPGFPFQNPAYATGYHLLGYLSAHGQPLKGSESSSHIRWFTIAKIEL